MNRDLTVGAPDRVLRRFCLPLLISVIFQQFYNVADSLIAGKLIGEDALAAVGNSYEITLAFLAFAFGVNTGCSVVVSRLFGAGQKRDVRTAVSTAVIAGGLTCLVLVGAGLLFADALLGLIRTPGDIFDLSALYLRIYLIGFPFLLIYNVMTGTFTALGDSRTPLLFLLGSSLANIALDLVFVTVLRDLFPRGVDGLAWATAICQAVCCVISVFVLRRRLRALDDAANVPLFSFGLLRKIAAVALPSMLQQGVISAGNIVIQSIVNACGTAVVAGYAAAIKLNNLVITSMTALGSGLSSFTAQNLGARKSERVRQGFFASCRILLVFCAPVILLYTLAAGPMISLFLNDTSTEALHTGVMFLRIVAPFYLVVGAKLAADGVLRGAARMGRFTAATFTDLFLRVALAAALSIPFGATGIWMAWPVGWAVGMALSALFTRRTMRELAQ